jgi:hypothetical protein
MDHDPGYDLENGSGCRAFGFGHRRDHYLPHLSELFSPTSLVGGPYYAQHPIIWGIQSGSTGLNLFTGTSLSEQYGGSWVPSIFSVANGSVPTSTNSFNGPCLTVACTLDTSDHIYVNGVEQAYSSQGSSASSATNSAGYELGTQAGAQTGAYSGTIEYAKIYASVLTPTQIAQETAYIQRQVSVRPGFPTFPQSSSFTPQLICAGDSLSAGYKGAEWCNSTYLTTANSYNYAEWGLPSDQASSEAGLDQGRILTAVAPNAGRSIVSMMYCTNDLFFGYSPAQCWQLLQKIGADVRAAGGIPVISTIPSNSSTDSQRQTLDALIRANWQTAGFAALDDEAAIPGLGATGAYTNTACFNSNQTHLSGPGAGSCYNSLTGYSLLAWNLGRVVDIMDGSTDGAPTVTASNSYVQANGDNVVLHTPTASATDQLIDCTGLTSIKRKIGRCCKLCRVAA